MTVCGVTVTIYQFELYEKLSGVLKWISQIHRFLYTCTYSSWDSRGGRSRHKLVDHFLGPLDILVLRNGRADQSDEKKYQQLHRWFWLTVCTFWISGGLIYSLDLIEYHDNRPLSAWYRISNLQSQIFFICIGIACSSRTISIKQNVRWFFDKSWFHWPNQFANYKSIDIISSLSIYR